MSYTAAIPLTRSRFGLSLPLAVGLVVFAALAYSGTMLLADPDTYWQIVAGRWIIAHHAVPHVDVFSNSALGTPWVAHEWLTQIVIAGVFDRFGWSGLVVAAAAAFACAMAALTRVLLRVLEPAHALIGTATAWGMCLPHLFARPHVFAMPFMVLWLGALVEARRRDRVPAPAAALIMVVWANLHGGYILGLALAALCGGEAVVSAGERRAALAAARQWAGFGMVALAAALCTPNSLTALWYPVHLMRMSYTLSLVMEFQSPNFQQFQPLEAWILVALLGALTLGLRLPWTRVVMLLALVHLALTHVRNTEVLGIAAPILLAGPIAADLARRGTLRAGSALDRFLAEFAKPARPAALALACALAVTIALPRLAAPLTRGPDPFTPAAALAAVAANHVTGPVLNSYGFGGYLIYSGIAPFIDGRSDMYGDAFMRRFIDATQGLAPTLPALIARYGIAWTLFEAKSPSVVLMDQMPGWHRLYADDIAVVHVRDR